MLAEPCDRRLAGAPNRLRTDRALGNDQARSVGEAPDGATCPADFRGDDANILRDEKHHLNYSHGLREVSPSRQPVSGQQPIQVVCFLA